MKTKTFPLFSAMTLFVTLGVPIFAQNTQPISAPWTDPKAQAKILDQYGKLPLSFEANHGQTDGRVKFLSRGHGYSLFLTGNEAVIALKKAAPKSDGMKGFPVLNRIEPQKEKAGQGTVVRMELAGANAALRVEGAEELPGKTNYFIGNDPAKWRTNVPTYAKVKYAGVYPGVVLVYYGNQGQLEYDFVVVPGTDPGSIRLRFHGAGKLRIEKNGDLLLKDGGEQIRLLKPEIYQEANGTRKAVKGRYWMTAADTMSFAVAEYDRSKPLVIDPILEYSTYLGGSNGESGNGIAVDASGNAYVTGATLSTDFPTTNPLRANLSGVETAFVTKINASGTTLIYSTYLGGSNGAAGGIALGAGIAVDASGNGYVTGETDSTDFPTVSPLQATYGGGQWNAFVTKINANGSALLYSTYLGGSFADIGYHIAVDASGNAYVTGFTGSRNFPTANALQATNRGPVNAFVTKINASGSALIYSTYLGGAVYDYGTSIAVDASGNAYVTGVTSSTDFPTANALQAIYGGNSPGNPAGDAFVTKINASGSALIYSTYLGGAVSDAGTSIAVDASGNAYITGSTDSTNFPTANALQATLRELQSVFVTKINASGTALIYSTYLGGSNCCNGESGGGEDGTGIAVDASGNAYVTGQTTSTDFPTVNALQATLRGESDAFITKINASGSALIYSTYLGGTDNDYGASIAVDASGNAYVTGFAPSPNFPTANALQATYGGNGDAFVAKLGYVLTSATTSASSSNPSVFGQTVTFTATVTPQGPDTPTGTVTFSDGSTTLGTSPLNGDMATFSTAALAIGPHTINAVYSGDSHINGSSASLSQTVNQANSILALGSSVNPSGFHQPVTFTATIILQYGGQTSGTVTFQDGATTLGSCTVSGNAASLTSSTLAIGTHSITAVYSGDSNFTGSTSKTGSQVVTKATTTTTLASSQNPSKFKQSVTFTATVAPQFSDAPTGNVVFKDGKQTLQTVTLRGGVASYKTSTLAKGKHSITATYNGDSNYTTSSASLTQVVN